MPGRIPQEFINDLLQRADIVEFIGERLELKKRGKNYFGLCPFHGEKTASFCVNPERQTYHCFGCDVNGTAITFLMEYDNLGFVAAVETLAARIGVQVPREGGTARRRPQNDRVFEVLNTAERYYRRQLKSHRDAARAQGYLKGRGITGEVAMA
ncbi:MAG: CHC2 zinc finger domain-containing protein, partial [Gammaproteobacteria bacterium]